ncbi:MAG: DUF6544 family protein [Anaerolineae bacterium]|jgi:hypothetical protein|nr:DUF6544 family protein [Anaerolineae bacterium]
MKTIWLILIAVLAIVALFLVGLRITPKPLADSGFANGKIETIPMPAGLPAPVERFLREIYGEQIPVIETAIISGRAKLTVNGITFPSRYRFVHNAGQDYRHYIESTIFGFPILKVNEKYVDGHSLFSLPFGTLEDDPNTNQGANLALWAEAVWFPAVWATNPQVEWLVVDDNTVVMKVPFEDEMESVLLRFDPQTGLLSYLEAMRFKGETDTQKRLWMNEVNGWKESEGWLVPDPAAVIWFTDREPWAVFHTDEVIYNADFGGYIDEVGP